MKIKKARMRGMKIEKGRRGMKIEKKEEEERDEDSEGGRGEG